MALQEIFTNLRNLWLLIFIFILVYRFATSQRWEQSKNEEVLITRVEPEAQPTPVIVVEPIVAIEKEEEKKEEEPVVPVIKKKVRPILEWDYIRKGLEMEVVDLR